MKKQQDLSSDQNDQDFFEEERKAIRFLYLVMSVLFLTLLVTFMQIFKPVEFFDWVVCIFFSGALVSFALFIKMGVEDYYSAMRHKNGHGALAEFVRPIFIIILISVIGFISAGELDPYRDW